MSFLSSVLLIHLVIFIDKCNADGGIDFNLFHQNDYQLKFERLVLERYNKSLVDVSIVTFKYNRTIAVANGTFTPKIDLDAGLMSIVQVYKFMSNEYREFPIRFSANSCKAITANVAGLGGFLKCGNFTGCPYAKGHTYHICNWYPDPSRFPPLIPNGQYKIEFQQLLFGQELGVGNGYVTVSRPLV